MNEAFVEHINVTVSDPEKTAKLLCELFDWNIRWAGPSQLGGHTVHVGGEGSYVAVYTPPKDPAAAPAGSHLKHLNHIGVQVADLDAVEARVIAAGLKPYNHDDYEPGRRFYFNDPDDVEYEVIAYT